MSTSASAPGKLLLMGEYAVLEGAPALVSAVDRRARVSLHNSPNQRWYLTAPQLGLHDYELAANGAIPTAAPENTRRSLKLFAAVLDTVSDALQPLPAQQVSIDTAEFFHGEQKLGIGSSAAVAVALTAALAAACGQNLSPAALFELAADAHQRAQDGVGSNTDIAASVYGGCLIYRRHAAPEPVGIPDDLHILPIFTGRPASTQNLVNAVYALREKSGELFAQQMDTMSTLAERGCAQWRAQDSKQIIAAANDYYQAMQCLGTAVGADIISAAHERLHSITATLPGAAYKPSGAGGGDIGLLLCQRSEPVSPLTARIAAAGFTPLNLKLGASGVQVM